MCKKSRLVEAAFCVSDGYPLILFFLEPALFLFNVVLIPIGFVFAEKFKTS